MASTYHAALCFEIWLKATLTDQLGALGLVTNAVVLWNTIYIQKALEKLKQDGIEIKEDDVARLSPLQYKHVNVLGHYSFTLSEEISKGELRELYQSDYE